MSLSLLLVPVAANDNDGSRVTSLALRFTTSSSSACGGTAYDVPFMAGTCATIPDAAAALLGEASGTYFGWGAWDGSGSDGSVYDLFSVKAATKADCETQLTLADPVTAASYSTYGSEPLAGDDLAVAQFSQCHQITMRDSSSYYSTPVFQTIAAVDLDPLPAGELTATAYSGTDCTGTSATVGPGLNNGCTKFTDAYQVIITACNDANSAPCDDFFWGVYGDASSGYTYCAADTRGECELSVTSRALGKCSSTTLIDAGCSIAGDPPDRPNYGTTFATSASEASPPSVTVTFTSPGDVSDFDAADQATVKTNVADEAGVPESAVGVAVAAASVQVTVTITTTSTAQATAISSTLAASLSSATAASTVLGVTVSATPSVAVSSSSDDDDDDGRPRWWHPGPVPILPAVGGLLVFGGIAIFLKCTYCPGKKKDKVAPDGDAPAGAPATSDTKEKVPHRATLPNWP